MRDETHLGIPAIYLGEALHGFMALHAASFPQAIGLASAWNPDLVEAVLRAAAAELRALGASYALSPVLGIARDPRWGRTEESYGEDPFLAAALGAAAVRGLQGGPAEAVDSQHVLATAKHFAVHGQPEGGTNAGPANYAERIIREQFLVPFQAAVKAGVGAVMASYNEIDGAPTHINPCCCARCCATREASPALSSPTAGGWTSWRGVPLAPEHLSFLDASKRRVVEPGLFDVLVGGSSASLQAAVLEVTADGAPR